MAIENMSIWSDDPKKGGRELTNSEKWEIVAAVEESLKKNYLRSTKVVAKMLREVADEEILMVIACLAKHGLPDLMPRMSPSTHRLIQDAAILSLATEYMARHQKIKVTTKLED